MYSDHSLTGGGDMDTGNTVANPQPFNEAPGLNAVWVFGENMQAALGLNHQVAIGSNQQICVNPAGLMGCLGVDYPPVFTGLLGGSGGGNMQLSFGSNVALTIGQAFELNLGPEKIQVDGPYSSQMIAVKLSGCIGVAACLYAMGYGLAASGNNLKASAALTITYQVLIDTLLEVLMVYEMEQKRQDDIDQKVKKATFSAEFVGEPKNALAWCGLELSMAVLLTASIGPAARA